MKQNDANNPSIDISRFSKTHRIILLLGALYSVIAVILILGNNEWGAYLAIAAFVFIFCIATIVAYVSYKRDSGS